MKPSKLMSPRKLRKLERRKLKLAFQEADRQFTSLLNASVNSYKPDPAIFRSKLTRYMELNEKLRTNGKSPIPAKHEKPLTPILKTVENKYMSVTHVTRGLKCPNCGEIDRGNKKNGKPHCFKCNTEIPATPQKHESKIKVLSRQDMNERWLNTLAEPSL